MGIYIDNSSNFCAEISTGVVVVLYSIVVGLPLVFTPTDNQNYFNVVKSSLSAVITGIFSLMCFIGYRQLSSMTLDQLRNDLPNRVRGDIGEPFRHEIPEAVLRRQDNLTLKIKKIGFITLACSVASLATTYYHAYPYLIHS